eukprot:CAMPEP_0202703514 /NCGR_PEP_ID=MMETSP1385-20130828/16354_1 /ASSEMBLY_ACC=CAM_ASM_000861 /TAXON_ID=933848 /ORGANISM="Elphidium margaritaceum" /LENGTH=310 /DNA_ID=CAMNT_0049361383 /DNA_START=59 /DNA_END=991 /DNA_ORIENTATION=+
MWHIQKRHAGSAPPSPHPFLVKQGELPPIEPENLGRTGYGEIRGELKSIWGGDVKEFDDFPEGTTKLERARWYPWSNRDDYPPLITTSAEQNRRIWCDAHMETLLDHHPPHEVHASQLPDYHYFTPINNELDHKPPADSVVTDTGREYSADKTDVPRFFKTGIPKTPLHEQDWYIPRLDDGRFDWKRNIRENGYSASLFDARGWDRRFLLKLNVPNPLIPYHTTGARQWAQTPIFFRVSEAPLLKRLSRHYMGSHFDRSLCFIAVYFGSLLGLTAAGGHWKKLNWDNELYNYDMAFARENRKKGGFHGII